MGLISWAKNIHKHDMADIMKMGQQERDALAEKMTALSDRYNSGTFFAGFVTLAAAPLVVAGTAALFMPAALAGVVILAGGLTTAAAYGAGAVMIHKMTENIEQTTRSVKSVSDYALFNTSYPAAEKSTTALATAFDKNAPRPAAQTQPVRPAAAKDFRRDR